MKIDLTQLDIESSREFLEYFYAALRAKSGMPFSHPGSSRFSGEGYLANLDDWLLTVGGEKVSITWQILLTPEGSAISVEALANEEIPQERWDSIASKFVSDILVSVVSGKKEKFFKRRHFSAISGSNLSGEYWLSGYRFAPQFPDDESRMISAERYLVIDQEIEAIDTWHADELADERAAMAAAHLSLITDIGITKPIHEYRWFLKSEDKEIVQFRESTQHIDLNVPVQMPSKGQLSELTTFEGSVFDHERYANNEFHCPTETRRILRGLRKANPAYKSAFNNCSMLYQLALTIGRYHPTVRISYECAAIDAIVQEFTNDYRGFSDYVRRNIDEDVDDLLEIIHGKVRSAHWHGGQFALGETDYRRDSLTHPQKHLRFHLIREAHRVIRHSIFNWVMTEIAADNT